MSFMRCRLIGRNAFPGLSTAPLADKGPKASIARLLQSGSIPCDPRLANRSVSAPLSAQQLCALSLPNPGDMAPGNGDLRGQMQFDSVKRTVARLVWPVRGPNQGGPGRFQAIV